MDCSARYKALRGSKFPDADVKRRNIIADRQEKQIQSFWSKRIKDGEPINNAIVETLEKKKIKRVEMLKKWKAEKIRKLEEEKKKKKPIFKVGVVQRTATGSPIIRNTKNKEKPMGVKTRSMTKAYTLEEQLQVQKGLEDVKQMRKLNINKFYKIDSGQVKFIDSHTFKIPESILNLPYSTRLTFCESPKITKKINKKVILKENNKKNVNVLNHNVIKKSESDTFKKELKEVLMTKSLNLESNDNMQLHQASFDLIKNDNIALKEHNSEPLINPEEQVSKKNNQHLEVSSFRNYVESETTRLLETCEKWGSVFSEFQEVPSDIEGEINVIIGKTKLLTSDKFMQFKSLIDRCEKGDPLIKADDLLGFQDWVSIEVERINEDFQRLENWKKNNWVQEINDNVTHNKTKSKKYNLRQKPVGKSNIGSYIKAAMRRYEKENVSPAAEVNTKAEFQTPRAKKNENVLKDVSNSLNKVNKNFITQSPRNREQGNNSVEIITSPQKSKMSSLKALKKIEHGNDNCDEDQTPHKCFFKKTPHNTKSASIRSSFVNKGLNEKYFQPVVDEDSPACYVLRNGNF